MRKLILLTFLAACICAYPRAHDFKLKFDEIKVRNVANIKEHLTKQLQKSYEKLRDEVDCGLLNIISNPEILNFCVDLLFTTVDGVLAENYDPLDMPDMHSGFNYTLIITYHGELDLTNGKLQDFSTIHRNGDAVLNATFGISNFTLPMAFNELEFTYDYTAKIMGLGPSGGIEGNVNNLAMEVQIGFDVIGKMLILESFEITNSGHINFEFTGHALIDWLLNLLTDVVTALLKKVILSIMEDVVGGAIQAAIDAINESLANNTVSVFDSGAESSVYNQFLVHKLQ